MEQLNGWALLSPEWRTFDVFVRPQERGGALAEEMYTWAEEQITSALCAWLGVRISARCGFWRRMPPWSAIYCGAGL